MIEGIETATATQIAYRQNDRDIIVWGAPGVPLDMLALAVPDGSAWREATKAEAISLTATDESAARLAEIDARLAELDLASVRPLRAAAANVATNEDKATLAAIETEASGLRAERQGIAQ